MLKIDLPWLADGYNSNLKSEEEAGDGILPNDDDSFSLCAEEYIDNYADIRVSTPTPLIRKPRVKSAYSRISCNVLPSDRHRPTSPRRPFSARPPSSRRPNPQRLIKSAGTRSMCSRHELRTLLSHRRDVISPAHFGHDSRGGLVINRRPDILAPYLSRHFRCFDESGCSGPLLSQRLQQAGALPTGSHPTTSSSRPISARSYQSGLVEEGLETEIAFRIQRYIDYHRPHTAPSGGDCEYSPKNHFLIRGHAPHFCSFIQRVPLHERPSSCHTPREGWVDLDVFTDTAVTEATDNNESQFDVSSFSNVSGLDGRTTPSGAGVSGDEADHDCDTDHDHDHGDGGDKNKDVNLLSHIGVTVTPTKKDKKPDNNKGIIRFGFPVSKPPQPIKSSKTKKVSKKANKNKKTKNDLHNKSKVTKNTTQESKATKKPDAASIIEKILDQNDKTTDNKDDDNDKKRAGIIKKEKKIEKNVKPSLPIVIKISLSPEPEDIKSPVEDIHPPEVHRPDLPDVLATSEPQLPDLPKLRTPEPPKELKNQTRQRSQISSPITQRSNKQDIDLDSRSRPEFDINAAMEIHDDETSSKSKIHSWLHGRLALSQQSSRFELPMDMKNLESMSPLEYLRRHCVISTRRQNLYQKMYLKNKDKSGVIPLKDLEKSLNDVLVNAINSQQLDEFIQLLLIPEDVKLDCRLFSCIAAVVERLLYPKFLTADTADLPEFQKEKIECADFCALDWKFHGVKVNPPVEKLLKSIQTVG